MSDIREFEKWYRDSFPKYNLYSKYDQFKEVQAITYKAATLAQQAKIEALEIQVQELRDVLLDICCDSEGNAVIGSDGDKAIINEKLRELNTKG